MTGAFPPSNTNKQRDNMRSGPNFEKSCSAPEGPPLGGPFIVRHVRLPIHLPKTIARNLTHNLPPPAILSTDSILRRPSSGPSSRPSSCPSALEVQQHAARVLHHLLDVLQEGDRLPPVDQAVVVRQRDVHHGAGHDLGGRGFYDRGGGQGMSARRGGWREDGERETAKVCGEAGVYAHTPTCGKTPILFHTRGCNTQLTHPRDGLYITNYLKARPLRTWSPMHTGRLWIECMPRMADWGQRRGGRGEGTC